MQKHTSTDTKSDIEHILFSAREKLAERGVTLDRRQALAVALLLIVTIGGSLILYRASQPKPVVIAKAGENARSNARATGKDETSSSKQSKDKEVQVLFVHVAGAVARPGVYQVKEGSRVIDALGAAGGALNPSDSNALNLAAKVCDGQKIYVPKKGEAPPPQVEEASGMGSGAPLASGAKVNLNTASMEQLDALPGVGPSTAKRIIDYRNTSGPFKRVDNLKDVDGIGAKKFDQLKDLVCAD
ncbi:MAG: helix-hairpin-helix domain-containing protein [Candidatus Aquicultor sp.]